MIRKFLGYSAAVFFLIHIPIMPAFAQTDALALSITPPLIKNNISLGQLWQSSVKVVNNNEQEIRVYVQSLDFQGNGEDGTVAFIEPSGSESEAGYLLSRWIDLPEESVVIPPLQSVEVPFIVNVPENAAPGGHYAAILVGTRPPADAVSGTSIKISSLIATLVMLNVSGDIVENGQIREFSTDKAVFGQGDVNFKVRFENLGNVHVQPQGEIRITDMWNKNIDLIKINHSSDFGNVLPRSIRSWDFHWEKPISLLEMGRYRAELTLSYGTEARETVAQTRYFWILLYKPLAIIILSIIIFFLLIYLLIRRSVRKAIRDTERLTGIIRPEQKAAARVTVLPKENGSDDRVVVNLKNPAGTDQAEAVPSRGLGWRVFKVFLYLAILAAISFLSLLAWREFRPLENNDLIISEDILSEPAEIADTVVEPASTDTATSAPSAVSAPAEPAASTTESAEIISPSLSVVALNGSGLPGAALRAKEALIGAGFTVATAGNADNFDYQNTVIKYPLSAEKSAERIKTLFPAPVELQISADAAEITVITGKNY